MTDARSTVLLDADPDLGRLLDDERHAEARRQLVVRKHTVEPGQWDGERLRDAGPEHVGLFILAGLMTRDGGVLASAVGLSTATYEDGGEAGVSTPGSLFRARVDTNSLLAEGSGRSRTHSTTPAT